VTFFFPDFGGSAPKRQTCFGIIGEIKLNLPLHNRILQFVVVYF